MTTPYQKVVLGPLATLNFDIAGIGRILEGQMARRGASFTGDQTKRWSAFASMFKDDGVLPADLCGEWDFFMS